MFRYPFGYGYKKNPLKLRFAEDFSFNCLWLIKIHFIYIVIKNNSGEKILDNNKNIINENLHLESYDYLAAGEKILSFIGDN